MGDFLGLDFSKSMKIEPKWAGHFWAPYHGHTCYPNEICSIRDNTYVNRSLQSKSTKRWPTFEGLPLRIGYLNTSPTFWARVKSEASKSETSIEVDGWLIISDDEIIIYLDASSFFETWVKSKISKNRTSIEVNDDFVIWDDESSSDLNTCSIFWIALISGSVKIEQQRPNKIGRSTRSAAVGRRQVRTQRIVLSSTKSGKIGRYRPHFPEIKISRKFLEKF